MTLKGAKLVYWCSRLSCFKKLANCLCGAQFRLNERRSLTNKAIQRGGGESRGALKLLGRGLRLWVAT